ncbi:hypothetical protein POTOM_051127 [Populus tomentosa]|uniref:Cation-transporting P-type ATPase N-terminal domain-containing protein n=1 Tax=Populus tomentosa TaxID=118781 RepID=A0A8X7Y5I8_POPTO|nr:hypothetical protein POTOM_051127 [Populus tomentosa]
MEKIPVEEVFEKLKCTKEGLNTTEGEERREIFSPNKLEEKKRVQSSSSWVSCGILYHGSWVMEAAAIMANGGGMPTDWKDFVGIVVLLVIKSTISFIEENNAGNAAAALMAGLAPKTMVSIPERSFFFQDMISIKLGDIIPANARLMEVDPLKIDQSALTGESLPVTRHPGDEAAHLVDNTNNVGHFQKVLTAIGNFCICSFAIGYMLIEIILMYPIQHRKYREGIDNLLMLLIGGIPIAPSLVSDIGHWVSSYITARNLIEVFVKDMDKDTLVLHAARASRTENQDAIDGSIVEMWDPTEVATITAVYAKWGFARIQGIVWGRAGIIWIFSVITCIPLDILKFITRNALTGKAWDNLLENVFKLNKI